MSLQAAERSPRAEVSQRLPQPFGETPDGAAAADLRKPYSDAFARLRHEASAESASALAALAVGGNASARSPAALAALLEGQDLPVQAGARVCALHALAASLDEAGRRDEAGLVLLLLAGSAAGRGDGMLGLGVLAVREGRMDEAFALATEAAGARQVHPRALSLLGVCELERGNGTQAQAFLAAAARLARRDAAFRAEMQIAQRALLLMHLDA